MCSSSSLPPPLSVLCTAPNDYFILLLLLFRIGFFLFVSLLFLSFLVSLYLLTEVPLPPSLLFFWGVFRILHSITTHMEVYATWHPQNNTKALKRNLCFHQCKSFFVFTFASLHNCVYTGTSMGACWLSVCTLHGEASLTICLMNPFQFSSSILLFQTALSFALLFFSSLFSFPFFLFRYSKQAARSSCHHSKNNRSERFTSTGTHRNKDNSVLCVWVLLHNHTITSVTLLQMVSTSSTTEFNFQRDFYIILFPIVLAVLLLVIAISWLAEYHRAVLDKEDLHEVNQQNKEQLAAMYLAYYNLGGNTDSFDYDVQLDDFGQVQHCEWRGGEALYDGSVS